MERVPVSVSDEEAQEGLRSPTFQSRREPAELILCRDAKTTAEKRNLSLSHSWRSQDSWPLYYITRLKCAAGITVKH